MNWSQALHHLSIYNYEEIFQTVFILGLCTIDLNQILLCHRDTFHAMLKGARVNYKLSLVSN